VRRMERARDSIKRDSIAARSTQQYAVQAWKAKWQGCVSRKSAQNHACHDPDHTDPPYKHGACDSNERRERQWRCTAGEHEPIEGRRLEFMPPNGCVPSRDTNQIASEHGNTTMRGKRERPPPAERPNVTQH
jgi:hypothetical protein